MCRADSRHCTEREREGGREGGSRGGRELHTYFSSLISCAETERTTSPAKSSPMSTSVRVVRRIRSPHPTPSPRIHSPHCRKSALCTNPRSSSCSCAKLQHGSRSLAGAHPADGDTRNAGSRTRRPRPNFPGLASPTLQPPLPTCRDAQVGQMLLVIVGDGVNLLLHPCSNPHPPIARLRRTDKPPRASWLEAVHHFLCSPWARPLSTLSSSSHADRLLGANFKPRRYR